MRLCLLFLLVTLGVPSTMSHADETSNPTETKPAETNPTEINPTDGSIIARLKAGGGIYSGAESVSATAGFALDAGYRSFDGFGAILMGVIFPSTTDRNTSPP